MPLHRFVVATRAAIRRADLLPETGTVVVACSGGADSLALLAALRDLCGGPGTSFPAVRLHVAHLDHGLRGERGAADAEFVRGVAAAWGLPATIGGVGPAERAAWRGSVEAAARQARYRFLRGVARDSGAAAIALGHTADDQAETVLLHLVRGSGLDGLAGMRPRAGDLVRPLLDLWRRDTEAFCRARGLDYREDETNRDPRFLRNRVRHELLPLLATYQPRIRETLARNAPILARDAAYLDAAAADALLRTQVPAVGDEAAALDRQALRDLPSALRARVLRRAILTAGSADPDAHLDVDSVIRLERVALDRNGARRTVELSTGAVATVERARVAIRRPSRPG